MIFYDIGVEEWVYMIIFGHLVGDFLAACPDSLDSSQKLKPKYQSSGFQYENLQYHQLSSITNFYFFPISVFSHTRLP